MNESKLRAMDELADQAIANWSWTALAANLLPPPFDVMAVGTVFGKMGARLGEIYEVQVNWTVLKNIGKCMAKGIAAVLGASYVGTELLKAIPGLNIWVALLIQPPMVGMVARSVGKAFKRYFHLRITGGRDLTPDEMRQFAEKELSEQLSLAAIA